eukprot:TRINITY_DN36369_c0_g1_i2.p1 TRINITY_DN36369_c0_g1~~TRINITY_DN36369_c0_g1_i2.p1  ORF type:complete len:554 (+),score=74.15 TRINITY_DN36369_c0_g1_i2:77-1738(+)
MPRLSAALLDCALLLGVCTRSAGAVAAGLPHVVFFLADDVGWNAPSWRNPQLRTPALEQLHRDGVELLEHYTYRLCAPTRGSFLSGRLPYKLASTGTNLNPNFLEDGLELSYTTIAGAMQRQGYVTHHVGKWHAGFFSPAYVPVARGFNSSLGYLTGGVDHYNQSALDSVCKPVPEVDLWAGSAPALGQNGSWSTGLFTASAVAAVEGHAARHGNADSSPPLFLYVAHHNAHGSIQAPWRLTEPYLDELPDRNDSAVIATFSAMVTAADETVANVTAALKRAGMWNRTLVVWTSDNGAEVQSWTTLDRCVRPHMLHDGGFTPATHHYCAGGSNAPLRGAKSSNWEGGVRTSTIVSGPWLPVAARGRRLKGIAHICDWYATLVSGIAGGDAADPGGVAPSDSLDLWPWISGTTSESPRTEVVLDHSRFPHWSGLVAYRWGALRQGDWKIFVTPGETHASWYGAFVPNASGRRTPRSRNARAPSPPPASTTSPGTRPSARTWPRPAPRWCRGSCGAGTSSTPSTTLRQSCRRSRQRATAPQSTPGPASSVPGFDS